MSCQQTWVVACVWWGMSWYDNTGFSAWLCILPATDQFHIRKLAYVPLYWILDIGAAGDDCIVNYAWSLWPFYRHSSVIKGCYLKYVPFSFYPWCIQSGLSLVKHGQYSKVRTVLKSWDPDNFKTVLTFNHWLCFTRDNPDWIHQG